MLFLPATRKLAMTVSIGMLKLFTVIQLIDHVLSGLSSPPNTYSIHLLARARHSCNLNPIACSICDMIVGSLAPQNLHTLQKLSQVFIPSTVHGGPAAASAVPFATHITLHTNAQLVHALLTKTL